jgi:phage protein D
MPADNKTAVPAFELTIGSAFSTTDKLDVEEIIVDNLSDGPSMFFAKLNAHEDGGIGAWMDNAQIALAEPVEVKMGFYPKGKPEKVFKGEVIGWEPIVVGKEPAGISVRGFDKLHRLTRGRRTKPWQDVPFSDAAKEIAGNAKLGTGGVEATSPIQPYIYQPSITDLEMLRLMAARVGYEVRADLDEQLVFAPPAVKGGSVCTLKWGDNLKKFKSRLSTGAQISKVRVTGWDVKKKEFIEEVAGPGDVLSSMKGAKKGPEAASPFEKESEYHLQLSAVYAKEDLKQLAKGAMNLIALNYLIADMEAEGENKVVAGKVVTIEGLGKRFDGEYYVVRSRHILKPNQKLPDAGYVLELTARRMGAE